MASIKSFIAMSGEVYLGIFITLAVVALGVIGCVTALAAYVVHRMTQTYPVVNHMCDRLPDDELHRGDIHPQTHGRPASDGIAALRAAAEGLDTWGNPEEAYVHYIINNRQPMENQISNPGEVSAELGV